MMYNVVCLTRPGNDVSQAREGTRYASQWVGVRFSDATVCIWWDDPTRRETDFGSDTGSYEPTLSPPLSRTLQLSDFISSRAVPPSSATGPSQPCARPSEPLRDIAASQQTVCCVKLDPIEAGFLHPHGALHEGFGLLRNPPRTCTKNNQHVPDHARTHQPHDAVRLAKRSPKLTPPL